MLAIASSSRAARLPQVATLAELGVPGVEADAWFALFAPAKAPDAAIRRLYEAKLGMTLALRPPAAIAAWLPGEVERWAAVIKTAGVAVE